MTVTYKQFWESYKVFTTHEKKKKFVYDFFKHKKNLHLFGKFFFENIIKGDYETPQCHIDLITEISKPNNSAIIFPRGFAKSTWEKIDTIHDVVYKIEPVILYISNTIGDAQFHFESMKSEFENNELLRYIYGDLVPPDRDKGKKWTNKHFETTNGVNVVARGAGKGRGVNIKNQRPTKIIADDIEDDEQVRSPDRRMKLHNWLTNVIIPSLDKERGKIKFIGTVLSPICEVKKFYEKHGGIFRKAIENGESIWPERFSYEDLMEIKMQFGSKMFAQEYMNNPVNDELAIIKPEWIANSYYNTLPELRGMKKIIMFDPQAGESKSADFYGLCVGGMFPKDPHRYILEINTGRDSQINQAALVVRTYQRHPETHIVGIEKVMTQVAVYQLILDWKSGKIELPDVNNKDRNIPILAVDPKGKDKIARLQMHEASIERGEVHLHHTMTHFGERLSMFPDLEHDDDIDSFIYFLEYSHKTSFTSNKNDDYTSKKTIAGNIYQTRF